MIDSLHLSVRSRLFAVACHALAAMACGGALGANFLEIYRWSSTVTDGSMLSQGDPTTLRWSIVGDGLAVEGGASDLVAYLDGFYGSAPGDDYSQRPWFATLETQLDRFAALTGLTFQYVDDVGGTWDTQDAEAGEADIRLGGIDFPLPGHLGEAERPSRGGDVLLDTGNSTFSSPSHLASVFQHELGHSLGLLHVSVAGSTVLMNSSVYPFNGPQFDDLYALTRLYGDKFEKQGGNDQWETAVPLDALTAGVATAVGSDADDLHIDLAEDDFVTIDGASDIDYYRIEIPFASEATVTLTPRGPTYDFTAENLPQQTLTAGALSDLEFRLLAADGQTPLASVNSNAIGDAEEIASFDLPDPGTYYLEVRGTENLNQFYELSIEADEASFTQTPWVFRDSFNVDGDLNAGIDTAPRQASGRLDSPFDIQQGMTPSGEAAVEIENGKLMLRGVQGSSADSPSATAVRNFGPELSGERWLLSLDVNLAASVSSSDAAFALVLGDSWPTGQPLSNDADLTVLVSSDNRYRIVEAGGNAGGEITRQGLAIGPDYLVQVMVDETQAVPEVTVAINGTMLVVDQAVIMSELERYLGLHVLTASGLASMDSVTAAIDNLSISIVTDTLAGDYNLDGLVNLADYVVWRNQLGRKVLAGTLADGNANGRIDAADYEVWKSNFGSPSAPATLSGVPEPSSWLLALLGLIGCARRLADSRIAA